METLERTVENKINEEFKSLFFSLQRDFQRQNLLLKKTQIQLQQEKVKNSRTEDQNLFLLAETNAQLLAQSEKDGLEINRLKETNELLKSNIHDITLQLDQAMTESNLLKLRMNQENRKKSSFSHDESFTRKISELEREIHNLIREKTENNVSC